MLPILVARQIEDGLRGFLQATFPVTTQLFQRQSGRNLIDDFLDKPGNLLKGPWLEMKLPFRQASDGAALPFKKFTPPFAPFQHQLKAFERLCGNAAKSTLIATGTGSGKTECFMYPLLDHCLLHRERGIKAILIYPMNALATDQAQRFARTCHRLVKEGLPSLSVGLYTGDHGDDRAMGPENVITDRETLRQNPPDILLTNYKMLDFLLMRPEDQSLWAFNRPGALRYLVVDELHTFDGAQGTDLACLIRRLRAKLEVGDELACVGTSATLGGPEAIADLQKYAGDIFASVFDDQAIVMEDRLSLDEYLQAEMQGQEAIIRWPTEAFSELSPREKERPEAYLARLSEIWLKVRLDLDSPDEKGRQRACVELGQRLVRLTAFQTLLRAAYELCPLSDLAQDWAQRLRLSPPQKANVLLDSLCVLASAARKWLKPEESTSPFLQIRIQLWLRELRRMVCRVGRDPELVHSDELPDPNPILHLPLLHCRECHSMAWGAVLPAGEQTFKPNLQGFYHAWFQRHPDSALFFPLDPSDYDRKDPRSLKLMCLKCYTLRLFQPGKEGQEGQAPCPLCEGEQIPVWMPDIQVQSSRAGENQTLASHHCPCCGAHEGMIVVGSRAASLASVMISELFGSLYNDDCKLIAFSDSVQDAAHRAGFFEARTYRQTLRHALAGFLRKGGSGLALPRLAEEFPKYWLKQKGDPANFVGAFIAPDMEWLKGYQELKTTGRFSSQNDSVDLVSRRMSWEVYSEFGLRSRIGRTMERMGVALPVVDEDALDRATQKLAKRWGEELIQLREMPLDAIQHFILGLLTRARQIGAFYTQDLERYVQEGGDPFILNRMSRHMPNYGLSSKPPAMLMLKGGFKNFENLLGPGSWFTEWFGRCFLNQAPLAGNEREQAFGLAMDCLEREGWLIRKVVRGENVWGLDPMRWQIDQGVGYLCCSACQHEWSVPAKQLHLLNGIPCLKKGCPGHYQLTRPRPGRLLVGNLYAAEPHRVVPSEHTGLLDSDVRDRIEKSFKKGLNAWDINLLSATPTLEMGIDIGDLSSVMLCSMPPSQANYLQRIGRAGRRDGNALALTIATGKAHDNYFYLEPREMMAGVVSTPGVFLKAMAVLERQLTAYCFDRWVVEEKIQPGGIPRKLKEVLDAVATGSKTAFPHPLLNFVEQHALKLLDAFLQMFPSPEKDPALRDQEDEARRQHFGQFLEGGGGKGTLAYRVLDRLGALLQNRQGLDERIKALKKERDKLLSEPPDEGRDSRILDCQTERQALLSLVRDINNRQTLNFFTDEGLLPNYAFPEEGVTLNSVILRRRERIEEDDEGGPSIEKYRLNFQRPAQAALGELVPDAKFYAAEHQLHIEQVDLKVSKLQSWRLCPDCNYCENIDETGDLHNACPRCGNGLWSDTGQRRTLLKLRQVYARADAKRDRIGDDSDERTPVFYQRQLLVDFLPEVQGHAFRMEKEELPFGFEYLSSVSLREINFGELGNGAEQLSVAGRNQSRAGFQICRECGMVRRNRRLQKGEFAHAPDCRFSRSGVEPEEKDWISSLYLYRELNSEAIRILLPLSEVAHSQTSRESFKAALMMGLRTYFKGEIQHLDLTEMHVPSGALTSQYLVLYDQVPGGTGYLKELMRSPDNLMSLLQQAFDRMANCPCREDDSKDGCYRCILAYRNNRNRGHISRKEAMRLLSMILEARSSLKAVAQLGTVQTNSLLESRLEERFIFELSLTKGLKVLKKMVNGKPGYWIHAHHPEGETQDWQLEPQVELGMQEGVRIQTRADFVLSAVREKDREAFGTWVIYLDGFAHHRDKSRDDIAKRMAVLRSGRRVWSLGWQDLEKSLPAPEKAATRYLQKHVQERMVGLYDQLAQQQGWANARTVRELQDGNPFDLLVRVLKDPGFMSKRLKQSALYSGLAWIHPTSLQPKTWADYEPLLDACLPGPVLSALAEWKEPFALGGLLPGLGTPIPPLKLAVCMPHGAFASIARLQKEMELHLTLDDANFEGEKVEGDWRGFWHCANVLQFAPRFTLNTLSDLDTEIGHRLLEGWPEGFETSPEDVSDWESVFELSVLDAALLTLLKGKQLPAPEVGVDLMEDQRAVCTAELCWPSQKVALVMESEGLAPKGWTLIRTLETDWMDRLSNALKA